MYDGLVTTSEARDAPSALRRPTRPHLAKTHVQQGTRQLTSFLQHAHTRTTDEPRSEDSDSLGYQSGKWNTSLRLSRCEEGGCDLPSFQGDAANLDLVQGLVALVRPHVLDGVDDVETAGRPTKDPAGVASSVRSYLPRRSEQEAMLTSACCRACRGRAVISISFRACLAGKGRRLTKGTAPS